MPVAALTAALPGPAADAAFRVAQPPVAAISAAVTAPVTAVRPGPAADAAFRNARLGR